MLKELYFGNIRPAERQTTPSSNLQRELERVSRRENQLRDQLNETERSLLDALDRAQQEINNITACENFILGFRLGARLMVECMDEDDGDTQKIVDSD